EHWNSEVARQLTHFFDSFGAEGLSTNDDHRSCGVSNQFRHSCDRVWRRERKICVSGWIAGVNGLPSIQVRGNIEDHGATVRLQRLRESEIHLGTEVLGSSYGSDVLHYFQRSSQRHVGERTVHTLG